MIKRNNRLLLLRIKVLFLILFFVLGIISLASGDTFIAVFEFVLSLMLLIYVILSEINKNKEMSQFMSMITEHGGNMTNEIITRFPFPLLVLSIDGKIV